MKTAGTNGPRRVCHSPTTDRGTSDRFNAPRSETETGPDVEQGAFRSGSNGSPQDDPGSNRFHEQPTARRRMPLMGRLSLEPDASGIHESDEAEPYREHRRKTRWSEVHADLDVAVQRSVARESMTVIAAIVASADRRCVEPRIFAEQSLSADSARELHVRVADIGRDRAVDRAVGLRDVPRAGRHRRRGQREKAPAGRQIRCRVSRGHAAGHVEHARPGRLPRIELDAATQRDEIKIARAVRFLLEQQRTCGLPRARVADLRSDRDREGPRGDVTKRRRERYHALARMIAGLVRLLGRLVPQAEVIDLLDAGEERADTIAETRSRSIEQAVVLHLAAGTAERPSRFQRVLLREGLAPETVHGVRPSGAQHEADIRRNPGNRLPERQRTVAARLEPRGVLDGLRILPRAFLFQPVAGYVPGLGPDLGRAVARHHDLVAAVGNQADMNAPRAPRPLDTIDAAVQIDANFARLGWQESARVVRAGLARGGGRQRR